MELLNKFIFTALCETLTQRRQPKLARDHQRPEGCPLPQRRGYRANPRQGDHHLCRAGWLRRDGAGHRDSQGAAAWAKPEVLGAAQEPEWWLQLYGFVAGAFLALGAAVGAFLSFAFSWIGIFYTLIIPSLLFWQLTPTFRRPIRVGNTTLTANQSFAAGRPVSSTNPTRNHAGVDFAGGFGALATLPTVYAITDGTIISSAYFWEGTYVLNVQNNNGTVFRYTEIIITLSADERRPGQPIRRGQPIGRIARGSAERQRLGVVFHLEYFQGTATGELGTATVVSNRQVYDYLPNNITPRVFNRRRDLLDPTWVHRLPQW